MTKCKYKIGDIVKLRGYTKYFTKIVKIETCDINRFRVWGMWYDSLYKAINKEGVSAYHLSWAFDNEVDKVEIPKEVIINNETYI